MTSWSTDYKVAKRFSRNEFSVIVCITPSHNLLIADLNNFKYDNNFKEEKEVILDSGNYQCEIIYLGHNEESINSMEEWDKEADIDPILFT